MKGKLRHVAIAVPDIESAARFYEKTFGMERINEIKTDNFGNGISLSDGVVNLTVLNFPTDDSAGDERGKDFVGIHHVGFIVDDLKEAGATVVEQGGTYHKEIGTEDDFTGFERKYRDPNGIVVDVSRGWVGTTDA